MVSEKLLIFLPKATFQENSAMLFIFRNDFLSLGPVVVFFSYLVSLSFPSCLSNPANVLQSVVPGLRHQLTASGRALSSQSTPTSFLDEEDDESKTLFTLMTISRFYNYFF